MDPKGENLISRISNKEKILFNREDHKPMDREMAMEEDTDVTIKICYHHHINKGFEIEAFVIK